MPISGAPTIAPRLPGPTGHMPTSGPKAGGMAPLAPAEKYGSAERREVVGQQDGTAAVPVLPEPYGAPAADARLRGVMSSLHSDDDNVSGFVLFDILQRVHQQGLNTQRTLQRGAQLANNKAKRDEGYHTLDQVLGQDRSAWVNTAGLTSSALLSVCCAILGFDGLGQIASQATQVTQPVLTVVDRTSQRFGGAYHASVAALALKEDGLNTQGSNTALEATRGAVTAVQEKLQQSFDFISSYLQRRADTLDRMAH